MQGLTAAPRDGLTEAQVTALIQADALTVDFGANLLDGQNRFVSDLTGDLVTGEVQRNCLATVHGTVTLSLSRELAWGAVRVQPWMTLSAQGVTARWNLGVFVLTTPTMPVGRIPPTYAVTGYDLLYLLSNPIGDSYAVAGGSDVLGAVRAAITASGVGGAVLLDNTATGRTLPADMVWPVTQARQPTYLRVVNDLLASISYRGVWCDENGAFRSEPYVNPVQRALEFSFTADDAALSLVGIDRSRVQDLWSAPNWWRFIQTNHVGVPTEGAGQYTVQNVSDGPSSQQSLGYTRRKPVHFMAAADQAGLQAQGDRMVAQDKQQVTYLHLTGGPFPGAGHFDVYSYTDAALGGRQKVQATQWKLPLTGAAMTWEWQAVA